MSTIDEHCKESFKRFGKEYRDIHLLLDFYAGRKGKDREGNKYDYTDARYKIRHREKRHHHEWVDQCRQRFGEEAAEAAEMHILQDFKGTEFENYMPSKDDYKQIGFWSRMQGFRRD